VKKCQKQEEQRKKKAEENIVKPNFHVKIPEGAKLKFELIKCQAKYWQ